jgi:DNA-binding XRE family transcriptional regulator
VKEPLRHPEIAAADAFKSGEGHVASSVSPSRRGLIYLDADTLRPIKPPVVVARKLDRRDFAARWQIEFGQKLSAARARVGLSQSDLARRSGVRQPHISKLEAGEMEPRLSTIFAVADTLGVLARSLFPTMSWQSDGGITDL